MEMMDEVDLTHDIIQFPLQSLVTLFSFFPLL